MAWKCKRCGECCNSPRIFEEDIQKIKRAGFKDFVYTDNLGNTYMKDKDGKCMFLEKGRIASCKIYGVRPETCGAYPSELNNGDCRPVKLAFDDYLEKNGKKQKDSQDT